jgi:hypothetical protein
MTGKLAHDLALGKRRGPVRALLIERVVDAVQLAHRQGQRVADPDGERLAGGDFGNPDGDDHCSL